jgi:predicted XRE-type DNA-binding protein
MGYADPDEMRVKFTLANAIALAIEDHALTQDDAAKITGLAQSDVLRIVNGVVKEYAVFRLMRALAALGKDISIEISNSASEQGMIVARPSDANDAAVAGYIVQVRDRREPPFVTVQQAMLLETHEKCEDDRRDGGEQIVQYDQDLALRQFRQPYHFAVFHAERCFTLFAGRRKNVVAKAYQYQRR